MSEVLRTRDPSRLSPYEAVLRSFAHFQRVSARNMRRRERPWNAPYGKNPVMRCWHVVAHLQGGITHRFNLLPDPLGRALVAAQRAVEISPSNHLAFHALASVDSFAKPDAFHIATTRAVALNEMDGFTLAYWVS